MQSGYVVLSGVGVHKDTKTHQMRRITLDAETMALLVDHREHCRAQLNEGGATVDRRTLRQPQT